MKEKTHKLSINKQITPRSFLKRGEGKSVVNANIYTKQNKNLIIDDD